MRMDKRGIFEARLKRLARAADHAGLQGVVVVPGPNLLYLTGFQSLLMERPFMLLVPAKGIPHLVAPAFEAGPYRKAPFELKVHDWTDSVGPTNAIMQAVKELGVGGRWGVEGKVPFLFLSKLLRHTRVIPEDAEPLLQGLRVVKDEAEVRALKKSARILSVSFEQIPDLLKAGLSESVLARKISDVIYANGGTSVGDLLVQSGPHAAVPHHLPCARKIGRGESLVIDVTSTFQGYYSDITRTFCLGQSREVERIYDEVLAAQGKAIAAVGNGLPAGRVDAVARKNLAEAGLGQYFIHRTGHGLGLEVHEAPFIVKDGREKLAKGMFFTVEPGVYVPGKLGVRIEDDVMVEGRGGLVITNPPKEFGWWK